MLISLKAKRVSRSALAYFFCWFLGTSFALGNTISYIHEDRPLEEVSAPDQAWNPLNKGIYAGFDNGVYWFKIELDASDEDWIVSIPESHISRANLYRNGEEIQKLEGTRYVAFEVRRQNEPSVCYMKVDCLLEARIPIDIQAEDSYYSSELTGYIIMGIYLGIVFSILLVNLFSYFSFKNITYLHYIFMVIGMSINAFYKDGLTALLFGMNGINEVIEPALNSVVVVSSVFFTVSYLQLGDKLRNLKRLGISALVIAYIMNAFYLSTGNFLYFSLADIFHLIALDIFWFAGVMLWKKSYYARFFAIAYGLPLLLAHDYYISPHFGIIILNLPLNFYKVGSVFEMIIFTYAIMYQARNLALENQTMRLKLVEYTSRLKGLNKDVNEREATAMELMHLFGLTFKEVEILKDLAMGKANKEIADTHFVSLNTVKFHIRNIFTKLEVNNRKDASFKYFHLPVGEEALEN